MKIFSPIFSFESQKKKERKEISIHDNNYYFTYIHELTIEIGSLNEEQVAKKKKELSY